MAVEAKLEESNFQQEEMVEMKVEVEAGSDPVPVLTEKMIEAETGLVEKSVSFKEESNFLSDLKENERKALFDLRAYIEEAIVSKTLFKETKGEEGQKEEGGEEEKGVRCENEEEEKNEKDQESSIDEEISLWGVPLLPSKNSESTNILLLKFLRARDFKPKESFEMLQKTLTWRKSETIDSILDQDLGTDLDAAFYMDGSDREGHPVCFNVLSGLKDKAFLFETEEGRERLLRWRVQMMEKGIGFLDFEPGKVVSLTQVIDLKDSVGPGKRGVRVVVKRVLDVLQDNYPELVARNIFVNVPFWYYALSALISPFLTQRTKSKFVLARPAMTTETLLKYISPEALAVKYGGLKREDDTDFSLEDKVSEITVKPNSTATIEIPAPEVGSTLVWDMVVLGWEVNYKEEFIPSDEGSYTVIVKKGKKVNSDEGPSRNSFKNNEPGKIVLTVENNTMKKKKVSYRHKTKFSAKAC
ncbi:hypothetical protein LUZ60_017343 [Juncus effusus]|nr:hypothetical protein LUZ60_017343 [Juncus effusus]